MSTEAAVEVGRSQEDDGVSALGPHGGRPTSSVKRVLKVPSDAQPTAKQTSVTLRSPRRSSAIAALDPPRHQVAVVALADYGAVRALAIVHETDTGPGVFADAAAARGVTIDRWSIAQEARPPSDPSEYDAVMSFGGSQNADQIAQHRWLETENAVLERLLDREVPVLGVCLGAQLLVQAAGGVVRPAAQPEIGWREVRITDEARGDRVLGALGTSFPALEWHSYEFLLPPGATLLARSDACLQACRIGERAWGIQFHAEVTLADYESWIDQYRDDLGSGPNGCSAERLRVQTRWGIDAWNELGRGLCGRFLDAAALSLRE